MELIKSLQDLKMEYVKSILHTEIPLEEPKIGERVRLFHGTTTAHINEILANGIIPRAKTNHDNWTENSSISNVAYLTNKWHYFYAYHATDTYMSQRYGEEYLHDERYHWWHTYETIPCYIECRVPYSLMIADEDFIFSDYIRSKIKASVKRKQTFSMDAMESLAQFGTVGVLGGVKPEYVHAVTVLGDTGNLLNNFITTGCQYEKEYQKWQLGKGKGKLKLPELIRMEESSKLNGTWLVKDLPKGYIKGFNPNPRTKRISIQIS